MDNNGRVITSSSIRTFYQMAATTWNYSGTGDSESTGTNPIRSIPSVINGSR